MGSVDGFMPQSTPTAGGTRREGIDFTTLWITAVASAAAAYTCSKLWTPGTLPSAAATPVLVALIREGLQRPAEVVTRAVPVRGVVRSAGAPEAHGSEPEPPEPPRRLGRHWRVAVVTGLLGFLVAAVVLTVPELVAGGSASGGNRGTTLFGGDTSSKQTTEPDRTVPGRTVTTPGRTVTVPPPTKTAPTAPAPSHTQTTPPATTTAPAPPPPPGQP